MTKTEIFVDAGVAFIVRSLEAFGVTGALVLAISSVFCAGAYVGARIVEAAAGWWAR